jgi:peptidoglycan/LPS O-acetylase OafA/YrhL
VPRPSGSSSALRLEYLDGLRALAALYVVAFHAFGYVDKGGLSVGARAAGRLLAFGHDAVAVFIVLSGYCLMLPAARARGGGLGRGIGDYFARRAWRILPPYYATVAASLAAIALVPALRSPTGTIWDDSNPAFTPGALISHLLVVHNLFPEWVHRINGPLWSVATEWQIYFFFPLVLLPLWRRAGAAGALLVAFPLGYLPLLLVPERAHSAIPWYLGCFALGMVAAGINFADRPVEILLRRRVPWGSLSWVLLAFCAVGGVLFARIWFRHQPVTDALVALTTATLLVHCSRHAAGEAAGREPLALRLLGSRPMVALGRFSYSIYLIHLPVLACCFLAQRALPLSQEAHLAVMLALGGPLSVGVAYAFFLAVERHFLRAPQPRGSAEAAAATTQ